MSKRELRALLQDRESNNFGSVSQGRTRQQTLRLRTFENLSVSSSTRSMDGSLGGGSNTAPGLFQRIQELERRLATAEADCKKKDEELEEACDRAEQATEEVKLGKQEIQRLAQKLEHVEIHCELEKHRRMEALRQEHAEQLKYERFQWERERERADGWLEEVKSRFELEKMQYEIRIQSLESELALAKRGYSPERELEYQHSCEEGGPGRHVHPESLPRPQLGTKQFCLESRGPAFVPCQEHNDVIQHQSLVDNSCNPVSGNVELQPMVGRQNLVQLHNMFTQSLDSIADTEQLQHLDTKYVQRQVPVSIANSSANAMANTNANVNNYIGRGGNVDHDISAASNVGHTTTTATTNVTGNNPVMATGTVQALGPPPLLPMDENASTTQSDLIESMTKLLQAQTQMLAAQAQAVAVQTLPPLTLYNGEESQNEDNTFDRWMERFEERARLAKWQDEQKLCQLKAHLEKTALQVFEIMAADEKSSYLNAVKALQQRFKPVDIEELRGLEFHQLMQEQQTVEQLGIELQRLGRKAFPNADSKEFDRMLKGRFFQALHPKWQRKVGAPKTSETFNELYDRARTIERQERQISASAAARGDSKAPTDRPPAKQQQVANRPIKKQNAPLNSTSTPRSTMQLQASTQESEQHRRGCWLCGSLNHLARNCPKQPRAEASGRSGQVSRTAQLTATPQSPKVEDLTEEQLEALLSQRRLANEQQLLMQTQSSVDTITANPTMVGGAVGPTIYIDLDIEGVTVEAMVDTGAQSTIISRALLHEIAKSLKAQGRPMPELETPCARLFGKECNSVKQELDITAQVMLTLETDNRCVTVPVFIQPNSEQSCLLGTNAATILGLKFLKPDGKPLKMQSTQSSQSESTSVKIRLVQASTVPGRKGRFLEATADCHFEEGQELLFEPDSTALREKGLGSQDCLFAVNSKGTLLVPLQNFTRECMNVEEGTPLGVAEILVKQETESLDKSIVEQVPTESAACIRVQACMQESEHQRKQELKKQLNLSQADLSAEQFKKLEDCVLSNADVFALDESELGRTSLVTHKIDTEEHRPIKQQPRRTPFVHREKIVQLINDMLKQGVIQPSTSAWASPVVLVPKKDGNLRFCVDYRRINAITKKDVYPLPRIDDILDTLGQTRYFSTLDLASGYWQIEMDPATKDKSAFTTHAGLFEFERMPFGLCNAPATFQRLMQAVLAGMEWDFCFVYLDDILVCSRTLEEHLDHLQQVFNRLEKAKLTLKPKKCSFLQDEVTYLGHVISSKGIAPDPSKTQKVKDFPVPTDVTKLKQFLGLASYYRRFIPGFAKLAHPLHSLTKKGVDFYWSVDCQRAFEKLKELLTQAPVLAYPCFGEDQEFILETDASGEGLGAVLAQKQADGFVHPVAYASRSLNPHEKNYAISELETLALVWAVKQFRAYILGHKCTVLTDHSACTSLLNTPHPSAKLARWAMIIQEMDLHIQHRPGKSNASADALSRNPSSPTEMCRAQIKTTTTDTTGEEEMSNNAQDQRAEAILEKKIEGELQRKDLDLLQMIELLECGKLPQDEKLARKLVLEQDQYDVMDGILHHENPASPGYWRVVVPKSLQQSVLEEAHSGRFAGHFAERRVYDTLKKSYWWKGMRAAVRRHCRSCLTCATRKGTGRASRPPLQPIAVGGPFHRMGVDVLQLPLTESGNQYAIVFLDYLTKWAEVFPVANQTAVTIAQLLVEEIFCRHGAPQELLSDRGANFLSEVVLEVCQLLDIKKVNTSGYHPQTDGLVERFNCTLSHMIAKCAQKNGTDWDRHLPFLLFAYRASVQESTRESPFYLLYGRDPRLPTESVLNHVASPYVVDVDDYKTAMTIALSEAWKTAQDNIKSAQEKQKRHYDRYSKESQYEIGDRVMVYMPGAVKGKAWKLARPFYGPYRVLATTPTNLEVKPVDKSDAESIYVSLNRIRPCYPELPDVSWCGDAKRKRNKKKPQVQEETQKPSRTSGPITRSMTRKAKPSN